MAIAIIAEATVSRVLIHPDQQIFESRNSRGYRFMPIYEYMCQSCKHIEEAIQKVSDEPLVDCPQCGRPDLKKQVTAASFKLKGGGWYETDFKNRKKTDVSAGTAEKSTGKDGEASKPAETKPDAPSSSGGDAVRKTAET